MLIQSLEQKTRLAMFTVVMTVVGSICLCCFTIWKCLSMIEAERDQIYILDGKIPFMAERAQLEENFQMEASAHINLFHTYMFNLPPDDEYIRWSVGKAMYLADGSALRQRDALQESGFYSDIVSASAVCTIVCDSISIDEEKRSFIYYGTQVIRRRTNKQKRRLVTGGNYETVPRSPNNPHGILITNWRTIENADIKY